MAGVNDIVITGIGCITPIGNGRQAFWDGLRSGKSAVRQLHHLSHPTPVAFYGAQVDGFQGKDFITARKSLKLMSRDTQIAFAAARLAWEDAGLQVGQCVPERVGAIYGSEMIAGEFDDIREATRACVVDGEMDPSRWGKEFSKHIFPLWMLRSLPNMSACHIGISVDARGPNNSIVQEEISGLLALSEAAGVIQRDQADVMLVGATGSRVDPIRLLYRAPHIYNQAPSANGSHCCIPFDLRRGGIVPGEGSGTLILERRSHAEARGAKVYGVLKSVTSRYGRPSQPFAGSRESILAAANAVLLAAKVQPCDLSHISAQGFSEKQLDIAEAKAIASLISDIPVTAFSSYFGTAGAGCGILELIGSILATQAGVVLPTLGYREPDPECNIAVCSQTRETKRDHFLKLSFTPLGQSAAVVVQCVN